MKKIILDDDVIKSDLDLFNSKYSSLQIAIAIFGTILVAFVISLKTYVNFISLIITILVVIILVLLYLILEFKRNDLVEKWEVKTAKIMLKDKSEEIKNFYKVNVKNYKNRVKILYEDYQDLKNNDEGYAVVTKRKHAKALLWYPKSKYEYKEK
ncbi:MAG: hypothetical protein J6A17_00330 [Bacilli bacterium]|mgnify:FL=1|nr:hypothetical protein [Bacilli bacterium]